MPEALSSAPGWMVPISPVRDPPESPSPTWSKWPPMTTNWSASAPAPGRMPATLLVSSPVLPTVASMVMFALLSLMTAPVSSASLRKSRSDLACGSAARSMTSAAGVSIMTAGMESGRRIHCAELFVLSSLRTRWSWIPGGLTTMIPAAPRLATDSILFRIPAAGDHGERPRRLGCAWPSAAVCAWMNLLRPASSTGSNRKMTAMWPVRSELSSKDV